jgi:predicted Zn-dependent protease
VRDAPDALELASRALAAVSGDEAEASVHRERSGFARFAASTVHQPTLVTDENVTLRVIRDGKVGSVSTNRTDDEGLAEAAARARAAADSARPDPAFPGLAAAAPLPDVAGWDEATAALLPEELAARAWTAIGAAGDIGLYGYFTCGETQLAVASTTGLAVSQAMTDATLVALAADSTQSGYASTSSWQADSLDLDRFAREAAETAARTSGAGEIEPGTLRAVLSPWAFGELLWYFGIGTFGALPFLEERSYFSGRIGERMFSESFSLADDALDPRGLPKAFDLEGVPKQRVPLVENGVVTDVVWDRKTAARAGRESTGHSLGAGGSGYGPIAFNLSVAGGEAGSVDELAEAVGDGIYVTRLHYVNIVDSREGVLTGMTRDGTFRIEGGRVTEPIVNLRFTTSVPAVVAGLLSLTRETTLVNTSDFYDERYPYGALVPAIATEAFTIVGTGSAPGL